MQANSLSGNSQSIILYLDMNSFFASCEQQDNETFRGKPIGVITHDSPNACVIAPSIEAKKFGVKTGMRLTDCKILCPQIIPVLARPYRYRQYHVQIMEVLNRFCSKEEIMAKSIDEAVVNLTSYRMVYKDLSALALQIKKGIRETCGEFVKCSIGIAPNSFLAKLGTELQKPDGFVQITPDNIDEHLSKLTLTDLPGIAKNNAKRLMTIGIRTPLEMRRSSDALLRKAFGGIVGNYWYNRLHFKEVDLYSNTYRAMSAGRTLSRKQTESKQVMDSLLIALCTRLEQRLVKQKVFCNQVGCAVRYRDFTKWDISIKLPDATQDALDLRNHIYSHIQAFERAHNTTVFNSNTQNICVFISGFLSEEMMQGNLFTNNINKNKVRKAMYAIKDRFGRDIVRKASETIEPRVMRDAIGFGSVKDMIQADGDEDKFNQYLLEESY